MLEKITEKHRNYFKVLILLSFIFNLNVAVGQDRKKLESEKKDNIEKIRLTQSLLENTREEYNQGTNTIVLLNKGINYRENLIVNYNDELVALEHAIELSYENLERNRETVRILKEDYGRIIKAAYHNLEDEYWIMYILSSEDINQAYQRIKYVKYLNEYRKSVYENIVNENLKISVQIDSLEFLKAKKEQTLNSLKNEKNLLLRDKNEKSRLVNQLKTKEVQLIAEIRKREAVQKEIENQIRKIIEDEARKAREAKKSLSLTPAEKIIEGDFSKNRGGLPWPTEQGIVTGEFGIRNHPVLKGIKINSNGIDISTTKNADVRAVFRGEVTRVVAIMGANYMVIIKHGNYRTIYQNLVDVKVKAGDLVEIKESIGKVGDNENAQSVLHFELWEKMTTMDPELWLSK